MPFRHQAADIIERLVPENEELYERLKTQRAADASARVELQEEGEALRKRVRKLEGERPARPANETIAQLQANIRTLQDENQKLEARNERQREQVRAKRARGPRPPGSKSLDHLCWLLRGSGPKCRAEAADLLEKQAAENAELLAVCALGGSILDRLRAAGWLVAVHNDYNEAGSFATFWLLTKGSHFVKGEGATDWLALSQAESKAGTLEAEAEKERQP